MGFGETAYTGVATFGRFRAITGAIVAVLIMLVMWVIGFNMLTSDKKVVKGTVKDAKLLSKQSGGKNSSPMYNMSLTVEYNFGGTNYMESPVITNSSTQYVAGQTISLKIDPKNPSKPEVSSVPKWVGGALIVGGLVIGGLAVGNAYISMKSKEYAAVTGTLGVASEAAQLF